MRNLIVKNSSKQFHKNQKKLVLKHVQKCETGTCTLNVFENLSLCIETNNVKLYQKGLLIPFMKEVLKDTENLQKHTTMSALSVPTLKMLITRFEEEKVLNQGYEFVNSLVNSLVKSFESKYFSFLPNEYLFKNVVKEQFKII